MKRIGVIADDFTGATDIAGFLVENGVSTIQTTGIPEDNFNAEADAYVVSLKSRSCPSSEAVEKSLRALDWLKTMGCTQYYFKYCSTFDSTSNGNIGPVTDALMDKLGIEQTVVCPALPVNGRTVYKGYLFVKNQLLQESGMKDHPITPMTDSNLARVIETQSKGKSGNIYFETIDKGPEAVKKELDRLKNEGLKYIILDCLNEGNVDVLGKALKDFVLLTGGSALAAGLARAKLDNRKNNPSTNDKGKPGREPTVIFAGSCSITTNQQIAFYKDYGTSRVVDPKEVISNPNYGKILLNWLREHVNDEYAPLLYSSTDPGALEKNRKIYGPDLGDVIESIFSDLAKKLLETGVKNFIIAGGETSGKIVQSLDLSGFYIGPQIAPGVPWIKAVDKDVFLALKSGNFGDKRFFLRSQELFNE